MPFLSLPVRPAKSYWKGWLVYFLIIFFLLALVAYLLNLLLDQNSGHSTAATVVALLSFLAICVFFFKHPYLLSLMILAVPVKISLLLKRFQPTQGFQQIHADVLRGFLERRERLEVLDISTGTCNSLIPARLDEAQRELHGA